MRGLTAARKLSHACDGLTARAFAALDRRLSSHDPAPVAVGVSGGGDSLALLALAVEWGRRNGRPILALSVDHGLQSASADWSRRAVEQAVRLGASGRVLRRIGPIPEAGVPAAARRARHALLAQAARDAGARVLLLGHTADDLAEARLMRRLGSAVGEPREWAPSPVWPEGRDIFLLRPLLAERRADLRRFVEDRGLGWIDDPANDDPAYARSRARRALDGGSVPPDSAASHRAPGRFEAVAGGFRLDRGAPAWVLAAAAVCAGGAEAPPRRARRDALAARLTSGEDLTATLCGAVIEARGADIHIFRDAGAVARGGLPPTLLEPSGVSVWDGRFAFETQTPGWTVAPAAGRMAALDSWDRKALQAFAPRARGGRPVLLWDDPGRPVLAARGVNGWDLTLNRLRAACGQFAHETAIAAASMAPAGWPPYVEPMNGPKRPSELRGWNEPA